VQQAARDDTVRGKHVAVRQPTPVDVQVFANIAVAVPRIFIKW